MSDEKVKKELDSLFEKRFFEIDYGEGKGIKKFFVGTPDAKMVKDAEWVYAKAYNTALKEKIFTSSEMVDILRDRNIIGPEYDKIGEDLRIGIATKTIELEQELDEKERVKKAIEIRKLREDYFQWSHRFNGPMSSTCEHMAQDAKVGYLASCLTIKEDGSRVWDSFETFENEKDITLQTRARFEIMLWSEGLSTDALENQPENKVLSGFVESLSKQVEEEQVEKGPEKEEAVIVASKPAGRKRVSKKTTPLE